MGERSKYINFGIHASAVLGSSLVVSTVFAVVWTAGLFIDTRNHLMEPGWYVMMACLCWLAVCIIALPAGGFVLSLLWPVTRRRTLPGQVICVLSGATVGIVASPLASRHASGGPLSIMFVFAATGVLLALIYVRLVGGSWRRTRREDVVEPFR